MGIGRRGIEGGVEEGRINPTNLNPCRPIQEKMATDGEAAPQAPSTTRWRDMLSARAKRLQGKITPASLTGSPSAARRMARASQFSTKDG